MDIEKEILLAALENAVKFKGNASPGAVIGKLMSIDHSIKSQLKKIAPKVQEIVRDVNKMGSALQKEKLYALNPDYDTQQKEKRQKNKESRSRLPPLPKAREGKVITRMPPGPSKYAHAGHAVSFLINYLYAKEYKGRCILRFDDTNPEVERQEFVDAIKEDLLDYLKIKPDRIIFASDDMDKLIAFAEKLISEGHAYCCSCPREKIAAARREMKECRHRQQSPDEAMNLWLMMKSGDADNTALRLKIDMKHKNAVMRDPVIYRVIAASHYRQGKKYKVWPLYDLESAVEDGLNKVTHVLRSNEFDTRIELQNHILGLLDLPKPVFIHYGRSSISGAVTQGRKIREMIESGRFIGWDDPRLVTLRALRRRGIVRESLYNLARRCGLSKQATNIDFTMISAENKRILDRSARRLFFLADPVKIRVEGAPQRSISLRLHPDIDLGEREMKTSERYLIERTDLESFSEGEFVRLIDNLNFTFGKTCRYASDDYLEFRKRGEKIIHFLPDDPAQMCEAEILMPDTNLISGFAEKEVENLKPGDVIQFVRFGFCRLDSVESGVYRFWFAHK